MAPKKQPTQVEQVPATKTTPAVKKSAKKAGDKYGSKAAGERVAGAQFQKMKRAGQLEETDMDESALQAYIGDKKYGRDGMEALRKAGRDGASKDKMSSIRNKYNKMDEDDVEEGNKFAYNVIKAKAAGIKKADLDGDGDLETVREVEQTSKKIASPHRNQDAMAGRQDLKQPGKETPLKNVVKDLKGLKAFVQGKPEPMDEEKTKEPPSKGTAFDPDYQAQAKKEKEGTGNFDKKKISTGTVYTRKHKDDEEDEVKSDQPKVKGRPKGPAKGPERVTAKSYKYKSGRPVKENDIAIADRGEYDDEVGQTKDSLHTIVRHARELESALRGNENMPEWVQEKIGQIKGMMTSVTDYILSTHERDAEQHMRPMAERSKSQSQARMMAGAAHNPKFAKKVGVAPKVAKEFNKADTGKDISRLPNKVKKTDEANDGNLANNAKPYDKVTQGDVVAGRLGKDEMGGKKKKEDKVAETTVLGSVATAPAGGKSKDGMQFGKGVYEGAIAESYEKKLNTVLTEAMNVTVTMNNQTDGGPNKTINVTADGEDAEKLAEILKLAGLGGQSGGCSSCGQASCGCETVDEAYGDTTATKNSPDWPTDTETVDGDDPYLRRFSGGLNGAKSTGQTTIPVIAGQHRRTSTMEENVELERSLFNTWKTYKGK
jgi:hypothetical protein